ncbi:MAG: hypothetical protein ACYSTT_08575 [Planctomycetota bacterium]
MKQIIWTALLTTTSGIVGINLVAAQDFIKREIMFDSPVHHIPCTGDCIPFYWKDGYHLFILKDGGWQHLLSTGLLNWEEPPMALTRGKPERMPSSLSSRVLVLL